MEAESMTESGVQDQLSRSAKIVRCPNCDADLTGKYCSGCGQEATATVLPLKAFLKQGVEDVLSFDFRYLKTLKILLKPGVLTKRYLDGQRIPYAPPLRFAFNASLLLLILIALRMPDGEGITPDSAPGDDIGFIAREYAFVIALAQFFALPVWAYLLKLGFKKQKPLYLSHLIFALYYHAVVTVTLLLIIAVSFISPLPVYASMGLIMMTLILGPYLIFALRRVYEATWLRSLLLWGVFVFAYLMLIFMFVSFFAGLSVGITQN